MGQGRRSLSFEEFKRLAPAVPAEQIPAQSDSQKIEACLREYERKADAPGAVHWAAWSEQEAVNAKYGEWLQRRLNAIAAQRPSDALKPHPALFYASIHRKTKGCWFSGTSHCSSAEVVLWKFSRRTTPPPPVLIKKGSLSYIFNYEHIKERLATTSYQTFKYKWDRFARTFPDKMDSEGTFFIVDAATMFVRKVPIVVSQYRGTIGNDVLTAIRACLSHASDKVGAEVKN